MAREVIVAPMAKQSGQGNHDESRVLFLRKLSRPLIAKMKAAAALNQKSLSEYVRELFERHIKELERDGILPKGKER